MNTNPTTKEERHAKFLKEHKVIRSYHQSISLEMKKSTKIKLKKLMKKHAKIQKMAYMKRERKSLAEIGKAFHVSREYVRQLLAKYYPDEIFPDLNKGRPKKPTVIFPCQECGKGNMLPSYIFNARKGLFCNAQCRENLKRKQTVGLKASNTKYATIEQKRMFNNIRTKQYYKLHRNDPAFKEKIKKYNKIQALRLKKIKNNL